MAWGEPVSRKIRLVTYLAERDHDLRGHNDMRNVSRQSAGMRRLKIIYWLLYQFRMENLPLFDSILASYSNIVSSTQLTISVAIHTYIFEGIFAA